MPLESTSIVIVVDRHDSALGTAAYSRAKLDSRIQVIAAMDYQSPRAFFEALSKSPSSLILFTWRFVAWELLIIKDGASRFNSLPGLPCIAILIPDHLGLGVAAKEREEELIAAVGYFLVTNENLKQYYSVAYPSKCRGILHDLPQDELIRSFRSERFDLESRKGIIWVGNSEWGKRLGFRDHKGFRCVVLPLASMLNDVRFDIFDSATRIVPTRQVLAQMARSRYLVQASNSEGTGLPLLEAMGVGTIPITTNVGVAEELLPEDLHFLMVERSPGAFLQCYRMLESMDLTQLSNRLQGAYENYIEVARCEPILFSAENQARRISASVLSRSLVKVKWLIRYQRRRFGKGRRRTRVEL